MFRQWNNRYLHTATELVGLTLGGFQTKNCADEQYEIIIDYLCQQKQKSIGVCHCPSVDNYADLRHQCEAHLFYNYTGNEINI